MYLARLKLCVAFTVASLVISLVSTSRVRVCNRLLAIAILRRCRLGKRGYQEHFELSGLGDKAQLKKRSGLYDSDTNALVMAKRGGVLAARALASRCCQNGCDLEEVCQG